MRNEINRQLNYLLYLSIMVGESVKVRKVVLGWIINRSIHTFPYFVVPESICTADLSSSARRFFPFIIHRGVSRVGLDESLLLQQIHSVTTIKVMQFHFTTQEHLYVTFS